MVYDPLHARVLLFGGSQQVLAGNCPDGSAPDVFTCAFNDLWEWDGVAWNELTPASGSMPAQRELPLGAWDIDRGRLIVGGGRPEFSAPSWTDLWEWNGSNWSLLQSSQPAPQFQDDATSAYDPVRRALLLNMHTGGTSALDLSSENRPGILFNADWRSTGADPSTLLSAVVDLHATALGYDTDLDVLNSDGVGDPMTNIELAGWSAGSLRWESLTTNEVNPGHLRFTSATPAQALDLIAPGDDLIGLRAAPEFGDGNGPLPASISLDSIELTLRYRLP